MSSPPPLDGLIVADFSRVLAGPLATMTLGDLGATVIKVERPGIGDETRTWSPPVDRHGTATYFQAVNRNKRSIALDLADAGDLALAHRLVQRADVLVENYLPGKQAGYGLDGDTVARRHPRLIYASITGFGDGHSLPGYDFLVQAVGGLMSVTGQPEGEPTKVGVALVDVLAGQNLVTGILAALYHRERTGQGQRVHVSLLGSVLAALVNHASAHLNAEAVPARLGNRHPSIAPYQTLRTADRPIAVAVGNDRQFARLAAVVLGSPTPDERFATNESRVRHHDELTVDLETELLRQPAAHWLQRLGAAGIPCGPVNSVPEAFALASALGLEATVQPGGFEAPRSVAAPIDMSTTPATYRRPPPALDEHGDEIREWLSE